MSTRSLTACLAAVLLVACKPSTGAPDARAASDAQAPSATQPATPQDATAPPAATEAAGSGTASAGSPLDEATLAIIQGSNAMAASLVACGVGTQAQADAGIASQRAGYVARGFSAQAYDAASSTAYAETLAKYASASPAQKAQACASVSKLGDQLQQMGKDATQPAGGGR